MNQEITKLLEQDHAQFTQLFSEWDQAATGKQKQLFEKIYEELEAHTAAEEAVLYPEMAKNDDLLDKEASSLEEHSKIRTALSSARKVMDSSEHFDQAVEAVKRAVDHHVREEEEIIFPQLRKLWSEEKRLQLGMEIESHKQKFAVAS